MCSQFDDTGAKESSFLSISNHRTARCPTCRLSCIICCRCCCLFFFQKLKTAYIKIFSEPLVTNFAKFSKFKEKSQIFSEWSRKYSLFLELIHNSRKILLQYLKPEQILILYISFKKSVRSKVHFIFYSSTIPLSELFPEWKSAELPSNCLLFPVSDFPRDRSPESLRLFNITPTCVKINHEVFYQYQYFPPDQSISSRNDIIHVPDQILENHRRFTSKDSFILYKYTSCFSRL